MMIKVALSKGATCQMSLVLFGGATAADRRSSLLRGSAAAGRSSLTLVSVFIQQGGRGAAHEHDGIEALYMLQGPVRVLLAGQAPAVVPTGQGIYHLPRVPVQEINAGSGLAHELAFIVTPATEPFRHNVDFAP
jgi:quercetin dioxygenase-like cupin family protein